MRWSVPLRRTPIPHFRSRPYVPDCHPLLCLGCILNLISNGSASVCVRMKFLGCPSTCASGVELDDTPPGTPSGAQPDSKTLLPGPQRPRNRGFLNVFRVLAGIPFRRSVRNVPRAAQPSRIPIRVYPGSPRKFGQRKIPPAKPKRVLVESLVKKKKGVQETSFLTTIDEEANGEC